METEDIIDEYTDLFLKEEWYLLKDLCSEKRLHIMDN